VNRSLQTKAFRILLICIFAIAGCAQSKDESTTQQSKGDSATQQLNPQRWEKLPDDGGEVLRLFTQKDVGKLPQIAILKLTEDQYEKFRSDPKKYLTAKNVFFTNESHKTLRRIVSYVDLSEDEPGTKPAQSKSQSNSDPWYVVVEHNAYCDSAIMADQVP
jgi:hypothetical protein